METTTQAWSPATALSRPLTCARLHRIEGYVRPSTVVGTSPKTSMDTTLVVFGGFDAADEGLRTWSPPV